MYHTNNIQEQIELAALTSRSQRRLSYLLG